MFYVSLADGRFNFSRVTHVNHVLNLAKCGSNGLSNERNLFEETSFANENVQQGLVDSDKLEEAMLVNCRQP